MEDYTNLKDYYHDGIRYGCGKCNRTYSQKKTLGRHLRFDCGQKPSFECQMCPKMYNHGYMLLKHMRRTHKIKIDNLRQRSSQIRYDKTSQDIDIEEIIIVPEYLQ